MVLQSSVKAVGSHGREEKVAELASSVGFHRLVGTSHDESLNHQVGFVKENTGFFLETGCTVAVLQGKVNYSFELDCDKFSLAAVSQRDRLSWDIFDFALYYSGVPWKFRVEGHLKGIRIRLMSTSMETSGYHRLSV